MRAGRRGVQAALAAALLFGLATPLAKLLLAGPDGTGVHPVALAGLLYLGSGVGLFGWRRFRRLPAVRLPRGELVWLAGAIGCGGVAAPVLLMIGLTALSGSEASLLLNAESVLTAVVAWVVFRENVDRRVGLGMLAIVSGAVVLSWPESGATLGELMPSLLVVGACLLWAVDNNLTRRVSASDATWLAMVKGLVAGVVNLGIAAIQGAALPAAPQVAAALLIGFLGYGVSLSLFVVGLRLLGTARTGAYFSIAPFAGAAVAIPLLGDPLSWRLVLAGALMGLGVWLHLTERHDHTHRHTVLVHQHPHDHADGHHIHDHDPGTAPGPHTHRHRHDPMTHDHPHTPDLHHRHPH
ncbi:MAG: EamA family transporter [Micropruina sp.]